MALDWQTCDGSGRLPSNNVRATVSLTRRGLMTGLGLGVLGWSSIGSALAQIAVDPKKRGGNVLVVVFLRGGADALSLVPPVAEDDYFRLRPNLAVKDSLRLDSRFGLHPSLAPLQPLYQSGSLAVVHAVGSQDATRSHFEAMDTMERGVADRIGPGSGWVARYLAATESEHDTPLRAVAFGGTMPTSLVGATHAIALNSLADFRLNAPPSARRALAQMYEMGDDEARQAGRETLRVLDQLDRLDVQSYRSAATYPESDLGAGLRQVACLVKADVGLEVACVDKGGWDTHVGQGIGTVGLLPTLLDDLGKSLSAFADDLGDSLGRVTVVVMSEFGRRIEENAGLGTDHGHGGVMFLLGGGVKGGQVHAEWPGLAAAVGPGDLPSTTDYRDVLGEVIERRMRRAPGVFAGHENRALGLVVA